MYCVKCGVRLQEGVSSCPLCQTPVWNPDAGKKEELYPDSLPRHTREPSLAGAAAMTVVCAIAAAVVLIVCFRLYGALRWGSYAIGGSCCFTSRRSSPAGSGTPGARSSSPRTSPPRPCIRC